MLIKTINDTGENLKYYWWKLEYKIRCNMWHLEGNRSNKEMFFPDSTFENNCRNCSLITILPNVTVGLISSVNLFICLIK